MLIFSSAVGFAMNGKIVGHGPTDPAANKAWQDMGNRPYSFVINNSDGSKTYVPFQNVAPAGTVMGIAADLASWADGLHQDKFDGDLGDAAKVAFMSLVGNAKNMNFLDSMFKLIEAVDKSDSMPMACRTMSGPSRLGSSPVRQQCARRTATLTRIFARPGA